MTKPRRHRDNSRGAEAQPADCLTRKQLADAEERLALRRKALLRERREAERRFAELQQRSRDEARNLFSEINRVDDQLRVLTRRRNGP